MNRQLLTILIAGGLVLTFRVQAQTSAEPAAALPVSSQTHLPPPQPQAYDVQVPAPSDPHLAKALDYVTAAGIKKLAIAKARFALLPITQQAHQMTKETDPAFWNAFESQAWQHLQPRLPDMVLGIARIYAGMFNDAELDAMTAFERSPAGQKLQSMRPEIARAEMKFTHSWSDSVAPGIVKSALSEAHAPAKPIPSH